MVEDVYETLAKALDRLPNGFPRTPSGVEILILKKIFSPAEAFLAGHLTREKESVTVIADRVKSPPESVQPQLIALATRGLIVMDTEEAEPRFRLKPWVIGIYEAQLETMDHELAHLVEDYFAQGGAEGIMKPQPALHRVIPAQGAVKSEWILPYDDVKAIIQRSKAFNVRSCICRVQQEHLSRKCDFPIDICFNFSAHQRPPRPGDITKEEALALLDRAEDIGLVHTVSNVMEGFYYVCNCCGCCCAILRGITDWGIKKSVAYSNYYSTIDEELCIGCKVCKERCQVDAISFQDGVGVVDQRNCIGCGLCVTGCPTGAAHLQRKPDEELVHPPQDFTSWELERLSNRGIRVET